jgi:molecular chaperone DnaK
VGDLVENTAGPFRAAIKDAGLKPADIYEVILVGVLTRMTAVVVAVMAMFDCKEHHKGVNPDEVVAIGAAVQGGVLSGDVKDVVLLDVTPLSLGVETLGGVMTVMIPRNTTIPTQKKEIYSTAADSQPSVEIHVLQGERADASSNRTLGRFKLDGIPPAPRGMPKIEVSFDIDANGILSVVAKDMATNKDQKITITASSGLSEDDVKKMVNEAAAHEAEDKKRREEVDRRNKLDTMCYTLEKQVAENKDKLEGVDLSKIEGLIKEGRDAVEKQDDDKVTSVLEALEKEAHAMAAKLYENAGPTNGAGGGAPPSGSGPTPPADGKGDVIDAEFEETSNG